uniref:Probable dual-specificity RNA methyltransferase RlmN n=1 Tax=candidate division CPR3 bacterium TaxID=2268181 RepID=A0A7C4QX53_UNCC3
MQNIKEIEKWVSKHGLPRFRAKQIYQAITKKLISDWIIGAQFIAAELPNELRKILQKELPISTLKVKDILPKIDLINQTPTDAPTIKIAFLTHDNLIIESVLMRHEGGRNTVCVSTQVGCPMKCAFCATGKLGFTRNLTAEEIVDQVLEFARLLKEIQKPNEAKSQKLKASITNIVFMGMGEPFANYKNVIEAIRILNDKNGFNLGHRHMTVSTSGIVPGILKFADEEIQVNLAISLHAPNNEIRGKIMPVNKKYPLEKLLPAVSGYMRKTNRKVFFEYILLKGINDSDENIKELISLLKKYFGNQMQLVHINLIEFNEIPNHPTNLTNPNNSTFISPDHKTTRHIFDLLQKNKILATVRYRFGDDINAACGQLAGKN